MIYKIQSTKRNTLPYKSISHFILERDIQFVVSLWDRWRDIYSERRLFLAPYPLPVASGFKHLHPLSIRIFRDDTNTSDRLRIPGSTVDSVCIHCLTLTAGFSYHVVSFRLHTCSTALPPCTAIHLFTNHNVIACQSTRGHQERNPNPCQQSLYSTCILLWNTKIFSYHYLRASNSFDAMVLFQYL